MGDKNEKRRQELAELVSNIATTLRLEEEYLLNADTDGRPYTFDRAIEYLRTLRAQAKAVMLDMEIYRRGALHERDVNPTQSPEYRQLEKELAETRKQLADLEKYSGQVKKETMRSTLYTCLTSISQPLSKKAQ